MAKESMKAREVKRAKLVARYAEKRAALKKIIATTQDPAEAFELPQKLQALPKNSNAARFAAYLATSFARLTSRAFIDSFAISLNLYLRS